MRISQYYRDPDIWTNERIEKEAWRFEGIRTLPGKTYVRDIDGNIISGPYILCIGDLDSECAFRKCQKELENDWINVTYVTKSRKEFGFHFYWLEHWTDDNDFITIDDNDLKSQDSLFEIGIGLKYTQLAGRHRKDPDFRYRNIGCRKLRVSEIMVRNGLYNTLLDSIFKDLLLDIDDIKRRRKMQHKNKNPFHKQFDSSYGNGIEDGAPLPNSQLGSRIVVFGNIPKRAHTKLVPPGTRPQKSFFAEGWKIQDVVTLQCISVLL